MQVDGRDDQKRTQADLSGVIRWLIQKNAAYAARHAHAEVTLRWRGGKLELVREEEQHLPVNLNRQHT